MERSRSFTFPLALVLALGVTLAFALSLRTAVPLSAAGGPAGLPDDELAAGQALFQANCAACHGEGASWTLPGCRPESLAGVSERFSKRQVMNLLDHGVMQMPSFAGLPQEDRDLPWEHLSTLPAPAGAAPTRGQRCPRVQAAMAGTPLLGGGCGQPGAGTGEAAPEAAGGGHGAGCGCAGGCGGEPGVRAGGHGAGCSGCGGGGCGKGHGAGRGCGARPAAPATPCPAHSGDGPRRLRQRWSFGR